MARITHQEKLKQCKGGALFLLPATALMNRLKYSHKFILILFLFLVPLIFTTYYFVSGANYDIQFAATEVLGTKYLRHLSQQHRNVSTLQVFLQTYSDPDAVMSAVLEKKISEIDIAFLELENLQRGMGKSLKTEEKFNALMQSRKSFNEVMKAPRPPHDNEACETLIRAIRALQGNIGDMSNLILDPDLDSYYLGSTDK